MKITAISAACAVLLGATIVSLPARAQSSEEMRKQIDLMQKQIDAMKARMDEMARQQPAAPAASARTAPVAADGGQFLERKAGKGMTFETRGGEVSVYGNLDLSLDSATKGIGGKVAPDGSTPAGNGGWMPDISSNISYVGLRGFQSLGDLPAHFVWQLETQIDVSATSGTGASNSNTSSAVKGGLTSRNSFIGLASGGWGAVKIGKTDAPYKTSTGSMNAFSGMWGDYSVIMGNTGGDNRVEFGTRLDHSIWWESPHWGGFTANALFSPGQNRAGDSSNLAAGEGDCAGGNVPGSGGTPEACNDGAFGNAYSFSAGYRTGPLFVTAAYEMHKKVNRTSDLPTFDPNDVADEHAAKIGAQVRFGGTTVSGILESMKRNVPGYLDFQNERTRTGTWLAVSQELNPKDSLHFGWAHANKSPGDPGVHNTAGGANPDNAADMFTLAWKHKVDENFSWYMDYATTINHQDAHYDLGAGGRSVTTDCHDASNPDGSGFDPNGGGGKCWAGGHLQGVSVGMKYAF